MMDEVQLKIIKKISEEKGIPFKEVHKAVTSYYERIATLAREAETPITIRMNYFGRITTDNIYMKDLKETQDNYQLLKKKKQDEINNNKQGDETS